MSLENLNSDINKMLDDVKDRKIIFFGAGKNFKRCIRKYCCERKKLPYPKYVCDNNSQLFGTEVEGIPVYKPEMLLKEDPAKTIIIVSAVFLEVFQQLKDMGLYYFPIISVPTLEAYFYFRENHEKTLYVESILEDDKSKKNYKNYLEGLIGGVVFNPSVYTVNPYYGNDVIDKLSDDEVIVSGGTYNGTHIDRALKLNKSIKFHAFEPNDKYAKILNQKYIENNNIIIHSEGLYDKKDKIAFDNEIDVSAKVVDEIEKRNSGNYSYINVIDMDSCIRDKVSLIELDIEGCEMKALEGAKNIIKKYKPKLAICVYHKLEDYIDIALYIKELNPNYKLYFRQHSCFDIDSVLYAI